MIQFTEIPATPGSVSLTPEAIQLLTNGLPGQIRDMAKHLGGTLLVNVEPPTPGRTIDVALSLFDKTDELLPDDKSTFIQGILEGAMLQANRRKQAAEL